MAHIQGCKKINQCSRFSIDENDLDQFGMLLLQMDLLQMVIPYVPTFLLLIANGVTVCPNTNDVTCRKHYGNSVIDYMLCSKDILV